jgi:hypothetical protein
LRRTVERTLDLRAGNRITSISADSGEIRRCPLEGDLVHGHFHLQVAIFLELVGHVFAVIAGIPDAISIQIGAFRTTTSQGAKLGAYALAPDVLVFQEAKLVRSFPRKIALENGVTIEVLPGHQVGIDKELVVPDTLIEAGILALVTSFSDPIPIEIVLFLVLVERAVVHAIRDAVKIRIEGLRATALSAVKAVSSSRRRRRCPRNPRSKGNTLVPGPRAFRVAGATGEIKASRNGRIASISQSVAVAIVPVGGVGARTIVASVRDSIAIDISQAECSGKAVLRVRNKPTRIACIWDEIEVGIGVVVSSSCQFTGKTLSHESTVLIDDALIQQKLSVCRRIYRCNTGIIGEQKAESNWSKRAVGSTKAVRISPWHIKV